MTTDYPLFLEIRTLSKRFGALDFKTLTSIYAVAKYWASSAIMEPVSRPSLTQSQACVVRTVRVRRSKNPYFLFTEVARSLGIEAVVSGSCTNS